MTRNEHLIEMAERLARNAAAAAKQSEKVIAMLERKPLTIEEELKKVEAAFWEDSE